MFFTGRARRLRPAAATRPPTEADDEMGGCVGDSVFDFVGDDATPEAVRAAQAVQRRTRTVVVLIVTRVLLMKKLNLLLKKKQ